MPEVFEPFSQPLIKISIRKSINQYGTKAEIKSIG